jgi:hypothetical protein
MADINVRSDAVDVEQIMREIRARVREKRGVDYTEAEVQQLAKVKLQKFLDPRGVRSDLMDQFRTERPPAPPNYEFDEDTLIGTHRGPLKSLRRLLRPILKLFFNPDTITTALHIQSEVNTQGERRLRNLELTYEILHNLTVEITRLGIEVQNLKMRMESLSSRLDFDERRARSLESVVQYRPPAERHGAVNVAPPHAPQGQPASAGLQDAAPGTGESGGGERRRRRRRRRRRPGQNMAGSERSGAALGAPAGDDAAGNGDDSPETFDGPDVPDGSDGPDSADQ